MSTPVWSSGWNIPGYLPEVEPLNFPTWEEAEAALREALEQACDDFEDDNPAEVERYETALVLLTQAEPGEDFCERVGNYVWWIQHVHLPEHHVR